ncbi:MAG: TIR domain-containing protein [Bacteroides sp.]|nr:TIR domain-containing protein [Bacillota bacterium]MCM1393363.1 TIR domain-containing protein [[Eubacterium] siraeum]MCM1454917.1 TIR domain-containing protein [Bacteroides sp.]
MDNNNKTMLQKKYEAIRADIHYDNEKPLGFKDKSHSERVKNVKQFLQSIARRVGCNDYLFTLCITELHEKFGNTIVQELWEILDTYCAYENKIKFDISRDDAFAAFYYLVHHYYREFDAETLKKLLLPKDDIVQKYANSDLVAIENLDFSIVSNCIYNKYFAEYPLIYELLSRYYSVRGDFNCQMKMAAVALKLLEGVEHISIKFKDEMPYVQQGENYGAKISCAGAICSIIEHEYLYGELSKVPDVNKQINSIDEESARFARINKIRLPDFINDDEIAKAEAYIDEAINFAVNVLGSDYPKYHYLKAKIKFYSSVRRNYIEGNGKRELQDRRIIEAELDKAIELEKSRAAHDVEKRTYIYTQLKDYVREYVEANLDKKYHKCRNEIMSAASAQTLKEDFFPILSDNVNGDYAFISYSSANFKPVYCDLLEMERKGINYWYDKGTRLGVDWKEIVRQRIKGCSVVLYYMSADSIASPAVIDELNYILQLKKPIICINLSGNNITSKTLIGIMRGGVDKYINNLTSETFKTICSACPDYIVMLQRDRDALNVYHIERLRSDLLKTFPSVIRHIESESALCGSTDKTYETQCGEIAVRPNEDYLICDNTNKIYIVADGISRSRDEYRKFLKKEPDDKSISRRVSEVFCDTLHRHIKDIILSGQDENHLKRSFENAFNLANESVEKFLSTRNDYIYTPRGKRGGKYFEKPGCVAIAAFICGRKLYYGSVGDCMGILVRNGRRIVFSEKQTEYAFHHLKVENDRKRLYSEYVNKPKNPYGYGVINGDKNAGEFFSPAHLDLESGDEIYIVSDGISDFISYCDVSKITNCKLENLIKKEDARRKKLGIRNDDKAIIRIKIS